MSRKPRSTSRKPGGGLAGLGGMNLAGLGLMDINNLSYDNDEDNDVDDEDLEAELNALMSGKRQKKREESKQKAASVDINTITAMANAAMKDDFGEDDIDLEGIENDEELMAELSELNDGGHDDVAEDIPEPSATPSGVVLRPPNVPIQATSPSSAKSTPSPMDITEVITDRLKNYRAAEEAAKELGDNSKARRFSRAIKTLEGQLRQAQLGKTIPEADIPPPVAIPKRRPPEPSRGAETQPVNQVADCGSDATRQVGETIQPIPHVSETQPPRKMTDMLGGFETQEIAKSKQPTPPLSQELPSPRTSMPAYTPQIAPSPLISPITAPAERPRMQQDLLTTRRDQYRQAARTAKQNGNQELAIKYVRTAKQFDVVLQALLEGRAIDLSKMPPPPPGIPAPETSIVSALSPLPAIEVGAPALVGTDTKADSSVYSTPPQAQTVLGALQQRLAKYQETEAMAKEKGDASRARRLGRIIKEYESAIRAHIAGKKVDFEELPTPPGFNPIPNGSVTGPQITTLEDKSHPPSVPQQNTTQARMTPERSSGSSSATPTPPKPTVKRQMSTTIEKQKQFLLERQRLFKEAAKEALKNGASKEQAMEYLRMMKGIEPMLQATETGLPVDLSSIPVPPQMQQDFVVVDKEDHEYQLSGDSEELYRTLEIDLDEQYKTCMTNQEHFFKLGDVSSGTKFEKLAQDTRRDISVLKASWKRGDSLPSFRYEDRVFTIVRHNHDVPENVMQVSVIRGITLPGKPNELDTYVKIDFAYPTDAPQSQRCSTVKDTTNPEYNFTGSFEVARKSRTFIRALKRVQLKIEVWSKRGFLRADGLLGVASIKLVDLETKCDLHEVFPVMDGRRDTGGKLEIKVRVSEPFTAKQVEEIKKRWLIIGK